MNSFILPYFSAVEVFICPFTLSNKHTRLATSPVDGVDWSFGSSLLPDRLLCVCENILFALYCYRTVSHIRIPQMCAVRGTNFGLLFGYIGFGSPFVCSGQIQIQQKRYLSIFDNSEEKTENARQRDDGSEDNKFEGYNTICTKIEYLLFRI